MAKKLSISVLKVFRLLIDGELVFEVKNLSSLRLFFMNHIIRCYLILQFLLGFYYNRNTNKECFLFPLYHNYYFNYHLESQCVRQHVLPIFEEI